MEASDPALPVDATHTLEASAPHKMGQLLKCRSVCGVVSKLQVEERVKEDPKCETDFGGHGS